MRQTARRTPPTAAAPRVDTPHNNRVADASQFIREAFVIVLGREVLPIELRDTVRGFGPGDEEALVVRLLSSPEFRLLHDALRDGRATGRDPASEERALASVGSPARFVALAYERLLGRAADEG